MLHVRNSSTQVRSVITITGLGDHDQPDWLITMTGIRTLGHALQAELAQSVDRWMLQQRRSPQW